MYIILLLILGFILRISYIIKPEGLWNDEYVSWLISATPFKENFWSEVLKQCHMPIYYLYLKPFASFGDIALRLTSIIPSVIAIYIMYLVGKEFYNKVAKITATITAILPFIVYYSQEVRFYSLLFLISSISLLFFLKLLKNNKWLWHWIGSLILILLTHVLGFFFILPFILYYIYTKKHLSKRLLTTIGLICLLIIPFGINILKMIPSSQWWGTFSYTNILFLFSDYFSPILTNHINAPPVFFYNKNLFFAFLLLVPTLIATFFITKGLRKQKGLFFISLFFITTISILANLGKLVFISKYLIEILPILILLFSLGIENKKDKILLVSFIIINIFSILTPYYPSKQIRSEGHKIVCDILNDIEQDVIIFTYYEPNRFYRYLKNNIKSLYISKNNRFKYVNKPELILDKISSKTRVSIVFLDSVSFIPENYIEKSIDYNLPEIFITFSKIKNSLIKELDKNYTNFDIQSKGSWTVITGTKKL